MKNGSTWRKWDLHFHTQSSYDYQDKRLSDQQIIDGLISHDVSVVAITDHHVIDVDRIKNLQKIGKDKVTVLPGIEFLSESRGNEPIHFIGIFPEDADLEHIWGQVSNVTDIKKIKGERKAHNEVYCKLIETAKLIHELGGIVTIHSGSKSNGIENITNSVPHGVAQKEDIANTIDIFEIGKPEDEENQFKKFIFPHLGYRKPIIICSDNHNINKYALKENCWIKAEPTFEGLKQIIYEPDRVKIQQENPESSKQNYYLIDKIKFANSSPDPLFTEVEIGFNADLNSIIGGKSSGKSLLLQLIAKSVMPSERFDLLQDSGKFNLPKYDSLSGFDMEVHWKDGSVNKLSEAIKDENKKPVTYIPQMYLNYMAENKKSDFRELIESILADKDGYKGFIEQQEREIKSIENQISTEISKYFEFKEKSSKLKAEIQTIGDFQAINQSINNLNEELEQLKLQSGLGDDEQKEYQSLINQRNTLLEQKQKLQSESAFNQNLSSELNDLKLQLSGLIEERFTSLNFSYSEFEEKLKKVKGQLSDGVSSILDSVRVDKTVFNSQQIDTEIVELDKKIQSVEGLLLPLQQNLKNQELLQSKAQLLEQENHKLQQINAKREELQRLAGALNSDQINSLYEELLNQYLAIAQELEKYSQVSSTQGKEIKLITEVKFNYDDFNRDFLGYINKKRSLENQFQDCGFIENSYEFDASEHANNFKVVTQKILEVGSEVSFNQSKPLDEMVKALFKDYFYIDYDLQQGHDRLGQMSPGKKGIILFQLFLHLSSSKWPILIDQPEDNLDNRSVYAELNNFIKEKNWIAK